MSQFLASAAALVHLKPEDLTGAGIWVDGDSVENWVILRTKRGAPVVAVWALQAEPVAPDGVAGVFSRLPTLGLAALLTPRAGPAQVFRRNFLSGTVEAVSFSCAPPKRRTAAAPEKAIDAVDQRFEALLFAAHSTLRDLDGLHPDEALDELCKLLELKLIDEVAPPDEQVFRAASEHAPVDAVAADLRAMAEGIATKTTYGLMPKASAPALAEIAHALGRWSLRSVNADIRGRAFQKILGTTFRADLGQYFTPTPIVELLLEVISPTAEEHILDPFCGSGHFLSKAVHHIRQVRGRPKNALGKVRGIDINERMVRVARVDAALESDKGFDVVQGNSLLPFGNVPGVECAAWDAVLTNPPFGSAVTAEASSRLGPFDLARGNSTPLEILGLERSVQYLRPGGRIAIVLPEGILTNQRLQYVREWLYEHLDVAAIIEFPRHAFAPLGANIATCAIVGYRRGAADRRDSQQVLMLEIESLGYDASGRASGKSEAHEAASLIKSFLATRAR